MTSLKKIRNKVFYYLLGFCLVSNAIMLIPNRMILYMIGLAFLFFFAIKYNNSSSHKGNLFLAFGASCLLSSIINLVFDYRLLLFGCIIFFITPVTCSRKLMVFREKFIFHTLMLFPLLTIASLYCYYAGINLMAREKGDVSWDFSAFFPHSMWLAAAVGLSNVVLIWLIFSTSTKILKISYTFLLLLSIYMSILAASRSALFASLLAMIFCLVLKLREIKKVIIVGILLSAFTSFAVPIYLTGAQRMQAKFENAQGKYGSRTDLFEAGIRHFKKNPLFGVGFAVSYGITGEKQIGRMESGSGWLSILFQTGVLGFSIVVVILFKSLKVIKYTRYDNKLLLFASSLAFLCLHSMFEGYILTTGYYPCILFWVLLGYLYSYPCYKQYLIKGTY